MGRAVVREHLGRSRYSIELIRDSQGVRAFCDLQEQQANNLDSDISVALAAVLNSLSIRNSTKIAYEADQATLGIGEVSELLQDFLTADGLYGVAVSYHLALIARKNSALARVAAKREEIAPRLTEAWCLTWDVGLAPGTVVGTIESGRQTDAAPYIVLKPEPPTKYDGQVRSVMSMTPAQSFLNYALFPGAAKWRPRYKRATIQATDFDSGTVDVWVDIIEAAGIYIHPEESFITLPYADVCVAAPTQCPFFVGDKVIVEYNQDTYQPSIVAGWAEWPRPCMREIANNLEFSYATVTQSGPAAEVVELVEGDYMITKVKNKVAGVTGRTWWFCREENTDNSRVQFFGGSLTTMFLWDSWGGSFIQETVTYKNWLKYGSGSSGGAVVAVTDGELPYGTTPVTGYIPVHTGAEGFKATANGQEISDPVARADCIRCMAQKVEYYHTLNGFDFEGWLNMSYGNVLELIASEKVIYVMEGLHIYDDRVFATFYAYLIED